MTREVTFDVSELAGVTAALEAGGAIALVAVRGVVQKGALNIKTEARRRATGIAHAPAYPLSITYDTVQTRTGATAEIGPDKDKRQGALGNIIEYGTRKNAPIPHLAPAADAEEPRFATAMEEVAVKALNL